MPRTLFTGRGCQKKSAVRTDVIPKVTQRILLFEYRERCAKLLVTCITTSPTK